MSDNKVRRAFRTTKIKISKETVPSDEQRQKLEELFMAMEAAKTDAVTAERIASISTAKAKQQNATAKIAEIELLTAASFSFNEVAGERFWIVYKDKNGVITLEGFTERLIRNNLRAQQDMLGDRVANSGDQDIDRSGLYEDPYDEDNTDPSELN